VIGRWDRGGRFARGLALGLAIALGAWWPAGAATPEPARGRRGMVVTSEAHATRAGLTLLEQGGNAVDAAVAAAFALAALVRRT
jgi:gamma-glutamyltranspeptidase/glutathione hydrolase